MIRGLGVDVVSIGRFERESTRLLEQILTPEELAGVPEGLCRHAFCARIFAAKEAVLKAMGCGLQSGFRWHDISVVNGSDVYLTGWLRSRADEQFISKIHVSYSSSKTHAVAFVLLESKNPEVT